MDLYEMNKKQLINKCKELNITKISNKNKNQLISMINQININNFMNKLSISSEEDLIYYNKCANIIIRSFKKYIYMLEHEKYDTGLGKWIIIIDDNETSINRMQLLWLDNIIGVTGWKLWKDRREKFKNNYSETTSCLCIYCGINEQILNPEKQYNWILHIGNKLRKFTFLKHISMRDKIWFKENFKTRQGIYSFNSMNVCNLSLSI